MNKNTTLVEREFDTKIENYVENYVCKILEAENFNTLNYLRARRSENKNIIRSGDMTFLSIDTDALAPYSTNISEKEFLKIVEANIEKPHKRSGRYQRHLFSHYKKALELEDNGYIEDTLKKAIELRQNITYARVLMRNKRFMKEWRRNFANYTPIAELKDSGRMRKINIILHRIE